MPSRRKWRGSLLYSAFRKVSTRSQATQGPTVRPPHAEDVHAVFPDSLLCREMIVDEAGAYSLGFYWRDRGPSPLPQMAMPRSTSPAKTPSSIRVT